MVGPGQIGTQFAGGELAGAGPFQPDRQIGGHLPLAILAAPQIVGAGAGLCGDGGNARLGHLGKPVIEVHPEFIAFDLKIFNQMI